MRSASIFSLFGNANQKKSKQHLLPLDQEVTLKEKWVPACIAWYTLLLCEHFLFRLQKENQLKEHDRDGTVIWRGDCQQKKHDNESQRLHTRPNYLILGLGWNSTGGREDTLLYPPCLLTHQYTLLKDRLPNLPLSKNEQISRNNGWVLSEEMLQFLVPMNYNRHSPTEHASMKKVHLEDKWRRPLDEVKDCRLDRHYAKRTLDGRTDSGIEDWKPHKSLSETGVCMLIVSRVIDEYILSAEIQWTESYNLWSAYVGNIPSASWRHLIKNNWLNSNKTLLLSFYRLISWIQQPVVLRFLCWMGSCGRIFHRGCFPMLTLLFRYLNKLSNLNKTIEKEG